MRPRRAYTHTHKHTHTHAPLEYPITRFFKYLKYCVTYGRTDIRTDTPSYRDARTHLKTFAKSGSELFAPCKSNEAVPQRTVAGPAVICFPSAIFATKNQCVLGQKFWNSGLFPYRVSQVNCNITKRRISASRNDKIILKKVQESSVNAIFSRTNLISLCLIVCPPAKFKMRTYFHLKCKFSIIVLCHSSFNLLSFLNALSQKSGNSLELKIN